MRRWWMAGGPMRWWIVAGGAVGLLVVLLVAAQLALPRLAEGTIEDRLTDGGGSAEVSVSSFPAVRLLWGGGGRLVVSARELSMPLADGELRRLGRFGEVDIRIAASRAGSVELDELLIERSGGGAFRMSSRGTASAAAARELGIPELFIAAGELVFGPDPTIEVDAEFEIDGDRIEVLGSRTMLDGRPVPVAGPIVEALTAAIIARL